MYRVSAKPPPVRGSFDRADAREFSAKQAAIAPTGLTEVSSAPASKNRVVPEIANPRPKTLRPLPDRARSKRAYCTEWAAAMRHQNLQRREIVNTVEFSSETSCNAFLVMKSENS